MGTVPREKTVCFTGHRRIAAADRLRLAAQLAAAVDGRIALGMTHFICGGALGFDTLAAQCVLAARAANPAVRLMLALPCRGQAENWRAADKAVYADICARADEVIYVSEDYSPDCMGRRNRFMVDHAAAVVVYCRQAQGGTANTVAYAVREGVPRIHLMD